MRPTQTQWEWLKPYQRAMGLFFLSLFLFFLTRLVFIASNINYLGSASLGELGKAVLWGVRFDAGIVFYCSAVPLLCACSPRPLPRWIYLFGYSLWLALTTVGIWANVFDIAYFPFSKRRSSLSILSFAFDAKNQLWQLLAQYWTHFLFDALCPIGLWYFSKYYRLGLQFQTKKRLAPSFALFFITLLFGTLSIRGGLQRKPLTTAHASALTNPMLAYAILNTPFVMIHTKPGSQLSPLTYFANWAEVEQHIKGPRFGQPAIPLPPKPQQPQNVVIIIAESFCNEFSAVFNPGQPSYTPFLDTLALKSVSFKNHFANGTRSIEAISSILAGVVSLMEEPFVISPYHTVTMEALPHSLKNTHTSHFYHGGKNGTFYFDIFADIAGFDRYVGLNEYPNKKDFDGSWGIFDEPFLQFVARDLTQIQGSTSKPFLASIFTLSAHNPYTIPPQHKGRFPKGTLDIHESMAYADYSLEMFFKTAAQQPWYPNTLFVITGDHTSLSQHKSFQTTTGRYRVPLIIYHPSPLFKPWAQVHPRIAQHADILPTVLHWLGLEPKTKTPFGRSLFSNEEGVAFNQNGGHSWILDQNFLVEMDVSGGVKATDLASQNEVKVPPDQLVNRLKSFLQYFNNGLIENRLFNSTAPSPHPTGQLTNPL